MIPLVGLQLHGHHITPAEPLQLGTGLLGRPRWSRTALLFDLELRLGLPHPVVSAAVRLGQWQRRMQRVDDGRRFYSQSFAADPAGTAGQLLSWRDELVEAGWDGQPLEGSARLQALSDLEQVSERLEPGRGDRLKLVQTALLDVATPYEALEILEPLSLWPGRWQQLFLRLTKNGERLRRVRDQAQTFARPGSDLAKLQRLIVDDRAAQEPVGEGDGSVVLLSGGDPIELADAVAAHLVQAPHDTCVIRGDETCVLDAAFRRAGLATQGGGIYSGSRPLLQILPLLLQLAYERRDPHDLLQLLTLPRGPFANSAGRTLVEALTDSPGLNSEAWLLTLQEHAEKLTPFMPVLSGAGWSRNGAQKPQVLELIDSVLSWLRKRLGDGRTLIQTAYSQANDLRDAVEQWPVATLDWLGLQQLCADGLEAVEDSAEQEQSGRVEHVDDAALLLQPFERVVFWNCVDSFGARPSPWREAERTALSEAGLVLPSPSASLVERARGYRRAVLNATERLILAVPKQTARTANRTHPLLDEIQARLCLDGAELKRFEVSARQLRCSRSTWLPARNEAATPLGLPKPRLLWRVKKAAVPLRERHSASSIGRLLACPLAFVFDYAAGLAWGGLPSLPSGPLLNGRLAHHLAERLHAEGLFTRETVTFGKRANELFDELVESEAMVLNTEGQSFERRALQQQVIGALADLAKLLQDNSLEVVGVEREIDAALSLPGKDGGPRRGRSASQATSRRLSGRIDMLLENAHGEEIVLDLKWGSSRYAEMIAQGKALQLAVYAASRKFEANLEAAPVAAYFSLAGSRLIASDAAPHFGLLATDDPPVFTAWEAAQRTIPIVEEALTAGHVAMAGDGERRPLMLEVLGQNKEARSALFQPDPTKTCDYCDYGAVCGVQWEVWR